MCCFQWWDAFGLPTENYAIKMKKKPQEITKQNTDMFRSQMKNWLILLIGAVKLILLIRNIINGLSGILSNCLKKDWPTKRDAD